MTKAELATDLINAYIAASTMKMPAMSFEQLEFIKGLADFLTVKGVKIGGSYRHYKGSLYVVTGVTRNADDWHGEYLVEYVHISDYNHKAVRKIGDFLDTVHVFGNDVPRFKLEG